MYKRERGGNRNWERKKHSQNERKNRPSQPVEQRYFGKLKELLSRDSNDILLSVLCPRVEFIHILSIPGMRDSIVSLVLEVIVKACLSEQTEGSLLKFLSLVVDSRFMKQEIVQYLSKYFNIDHLKAPDQVLLGNTVIVINALIKRLPVKSIAVVTMLLIPIKNAILRLKTLNCGSFEKISTAIVRIEDILVDIRMKMILGNLINDQNEDVVKWNHGEAFRRMSVVPTSNDLLDTRSQHLNKNVILGKYTGVKEYLDVQFSLLREDLIRPLREGLQQLLERRQSGTTTHFKTEWKVYKEVHIMSPKFGRRGISHRVTFDVTNLRSICWESSKRLSFGSLVCLVDNQFDRNDASNRILVATIADRDVHRLKMGEIGLRFEGEDGLQDMNFQPCAVYEMIESPSFFEAYRPVLGGLQSFNEKSLPLSEYILNQRDNGKPIPPPRYLRNSECEYNLSPIIMDRTPVKTCQPLNFETWPSAELLGLDDSQYNALKSGLTKELALIQGPPGTGKTFIGLKIIQVLLANKSVWNPFKNEAPILIVCYTNHALDQFLEGILDHTLIHSRSGRLIRIGGRSKSEMLESCHLAVIKRDQHERSQTAYIGSRRRRKRHGYCGNRYGGARYDIKNEMKGIKITIIKLASYIELVKEEIVEETKLESCMTHIHALSLWGRRQIMKSVLLQWLVAENRPCKPLMKNSFNTSASISHVTGIGFVTEHFRKSLEYNEEEADMCNFERVKLQTKFCGDFIVENRDRSVILVKKLRTDTRIFSEVMTQTEAEDCLNVWNLNQHDRWRLYNFWVSKLVEPIIQELNNLCAEYDAQQKLLDEIVQEEDYSIIKSALIIGMTTSGAAKHRQLLQRVKPRIVIVEEAAEVFEAHIVTSLTSSCEHLILIGDHQQLRPNPAVYELAKNFHLDVSLFERLVSNKLPCNRLAIQHRMRPEIAELIVPHIYKDLQNADSVCEFENIYGILGNVFFIDHSFEEDYAVEGQSYSNKHEAKFMSALCLHLLNVGYESKQITVLTTYAGQMRLLQKHMPKSHYKDVYITPVDNYQGEENDIILLSLVCSNKNNRIGFCRISNRICVALSRAKKGFFIIGNASLLADVSVLWRNILVAMRSKDRVVEKLPLGCREHSKIVYLVETGEDFQHVPFGGCSLPCDFRLDCGHVCGRNCHQLDPKHLQHICEKPCTISCPLDHPCSKRCCDPCGNCVVLVEKTLSRCHHTAKIPCYIDEDNFQCQEPCTKSCAGMKLPHPCVKKCLEPCGDCTVLVDRLLSTCGHTKKIACHVLEAMQRDTILCSDERNVFSFMCVKPGYKVCYKIPSDADQPHMHCLPTVDDQSREFKESWKTFSKCDMPCNRPCNKGHPCKKYCWENCGKCQVKVQKILPRCKHTQEVSCYKSAEKVVCNQPCERTLACDHTCIKLCGEVCTSVCTVLISNVFLKCSHTVSLLCFEMEDPREYQSKKDMLMGIYYSNSVSFTTHTLEATDQQYRTKHPITCKSVCNSELSCGHKCDQICSICTSTGKHTVCSSSCGKKLPLCSHRCSGICGKPCQVCWLDCLHSCRHDRCSHPCRQPCKPCDKPCDWKCSHQECNLTCSEPCTRPVCNIPCPVILECKHACMGLCGERCLDICIICNPNEFEEIEKNLPECVIQNATRYIQLRPCFHVFPVDYLDNLVDKTSNMSAEGFQTIRCPLDSCRKEVNDCPRYNARMKRLSSSQMNAKYKITQKIVRNEDALLDWKIFTENDFDMLNTSSSGVADVKQFKGLKICAIYLWHKCKKLVSKMQRFQKEKVDYRFFNAIKMELMDCLKKDDKVSIACKVVDMSSVYVRLHAIHLSTDTLGPKLKTLDRCQRKLSWNSAGKEGADVLKTWKDIQIFSNQLKLQFFSQPKQIDEMLDLGTFMDAPHRSQNYLSKWTSCTKGMCSV